MAKRIEKSREEWTVKSMKFNRFLWQRYSLAIFFFANLQWFASNLYVNWTFAIYPALLLILSTVAIFENFSLMTNHRNILPFTNGYCWTQLTVNIVLAIGLTNERLFGLLFPFFGFNTITRQVLGLILVAGMIISLLNIVHLRRVRFNKDKSFLRISEVEASLNGGQSND